MLSPANRNQSVSLSRKVQCSVKTHTLCLKSLYICTTLPYTHIHTIVFLLNALFCSAQSHYLPDRRDARSDNGQLREPCSVTDPILYTIWKSVASVRAEGGVERTFSCSFNSSWIQLRLLSTLCYICNDTWQESTLKHKELRGPSLCPFVSFLDCYSSKLNASINFAFVSLSKVKVWHVKCIFIFV